MTRAAERGVVVRTFGGALSPGHSTVRVAPNKPVPVSPGFQGCPAYGDGGDRQLNVLKNRVDSAAWMPTPFASVLGLGWPPGVVRRMRDEWSRRDSLSVAANEGLPVTVEGYFVAAKQEGPEATNCHGADASFRDWHLWLASTPGKNRTRSIVVETTPAIRALHPEWSLNGIHKLVRDSTLVRVSGWLMLDPEHPEDARDALGDSSRDADRDADSGELEGLSMIDDPSGHPERARDLPLSFRAKRGICTMRSCARRKLHEMAHQLCNADTTGHVSRPHT